MAKIKRLLLTIVLFTYFKGGNAMAKENFEIKENGDVQLGQIKVGELLATSGKPSQVMEHKWIENGPMKFVLFRPAVTDPAFEGPRPGDYRIARLDDKTKKVIWRASIGYDNPLVGPVFYNNVIIAGFSNIIYGFDSKTGEELWVYSVHSGHEDSFAIKKLSLDGDILNIEGENWGKKVEREFNAETGERIYKKTKAPELLPQPIYNEEIRKDLIHQDFRSRQGGPRFKPASKRPTDDEPSRPPVPTDWDAFRMGITLVAYSKTKKVGIIIDPLRSNSSRVIEEAKKIKDVRWLYVFDSLKIDKSSPKYRRHRVLGKLAAQYPKPKQLIHEESFFALDVHQSGHRIDAQSVAEALGAQVIDKTNDQVLMTEAGPIIPHTKEEAYLNDHDDRQGSFLALEWGPYRFGLTHTNLASKYHTY